MSQWIPVATVGLINLVGLAFAVGVASQRLKATEKVVEGMPGQCREAARVLDLEHIVECHPRTAKRRTAEMQEIR